MKPRYNDMKQYPHGYKAACDTDIGRTFERIRRQQKANAAEGSHRWEPIQPHVTLRAAVLAR